MLLPKRYAAADTSVGDKVFAVLVPRFDLFRWAAHGVDDGLLMLSHRQPADNVGSGKLVLLDHFVDKLNGFWMHGIIRLTEACQG